MGEMRMMEILGEGEGEGEGGGEEEGGRGPP